MTEKQIVLIAAGIANSAALASLDAREVAAKYDRYRIRATMNETKWKPMTFGAWFQLSGLME